MPEIESIGSAGSLGSLRNADLSPFLKRSIGAQPASYTKNARINRNMQGMQTVRTLNQPTSALDKFFEPLNATNTTFGPES
jgi:hypothetical protein